MTITTTTLTPFILANGQTIPVSGTATSGIGASISSVAVVSSATGAAAVTGTTAFTSNVPVNTGSQTITATATQSDAQTGNAVLTVVAAFAVPATTIVVPTTSPVIDTSGQTIPVSGVATTPPTPSGPTSITSIVVTNNQFIGIAIPVTGLANWSADVPLALGANAITVTATNNAGFSATTSITVNVSFGVPGSPPPPVVGVTTPTGLAPARHLRDRYDVRGQSPVILPASEKQLETTYRKVDRFDVEDPFAEAR